MIPSISSRYRDGRRGRAGDGARLDEDGDLRLLGRLDDVANVSGHRLSTVEIESALAAELTDRLRRHVTAAIGPIARPSRVVPVPDLPKTRSGKILRRLLAQLLTGEPLGDTTSLTDASSVARIRDVLRSIEEESS